MTSSTIISSVSSLTPFVVREYARSHASCFDVRFFQLMFAAGWRNWDFDNIYGVDLLWAIRGSVQGWVHWSGCGSVLRCDETTYVNTSFIRYTEEEVYASRLVSIVGDNSKLRMMFHLPIVLTTLLSSVLMMPFTSNPILTIHSMTSFLRRAFESWRFWIYFSISIVLTFLRFRLVNK